MHDHVPDSVNAAPRSLLELTRRSDQEITCEGLHYLTTAGTQLLRNLEIVRHDLALIAAGKRILHALDYSELHTFLWPDEPSRGSRQAVHAMFASDRLEFTLPPGAQVELVKHIRRLIPKNRAAQEKLLDLTSNPLVAALLRSFQKSQADTSLQVVSAAISTIVSELPDLGRLARVLHRLLFLADMKTLVPLDELLTADDWELRPDADVLRECLMSLNLLRPAERDINNFIDAYNYSLLWTLSNAHVNSKNTIYLLVTSSSAPYRVFRRIKWERFPETLEDPSLPELSLVRHPVQVLYLDAALRHQPQAARHVQSAIRSLKQLLKTWRSLPQYQAFLSGSAKATAEVRLPMGSRYLNNCLRFRDEYQRLYSPVREIIESDVSDDENVRRLLGIRTWSIIDPVPGAPDAEDQLVSTRVSFQLFDTLNAATLRALEHFERRLSRIPAHLIADVDVEGIMSVKSRLALSLAEKPEFYCREVSALLIEGQVPYFLGDVYADYFTLWWPTAQTFSEFVSAARWFLGAMRSIAEAGGKHPSHKQKQFDGIYLHFRGSTCPSCLALARCPDLNPDDILSAAEKRIPTMVRIATAVGDVFYEFSPLFGRFRQAGVMSHIVAEDAVSLLIYSTNLRSAGYPEAQRVVREALGDFRREGR